MTDDAEPLRKIIHIDMDAFYASVEQRDNPELRGRPVAVGGAGGRGVVAAASYEARTFGVRSAMPSVTAIRRCPELIFARPRFDVYRAVSQQIRAIFARYTPLIEPLSLDEAYLDVTEGSARFGSATRIAKDIRAAIRAETGLTASAGVSYNKFLAKLASDQNKPDGLCVVKPARGLEFVAALDVARFHGIGPKTAERMRKLGIHSGADLRGWAVEELRPHFGKAADYFFLAARAIDHRQVKPDRLRKSVGSENTFFRDLTGREELWAELEPALDAIDRWMGKAEGRGRTLTLKAKYGDFQIVTRSRTRPHGFHGRAEMAEVAAELLDSLYPLRMGLRLIGLTLSNLDDEVEEREPQQQQLDLALAAA